MMQEWEGGDMWSTKLTREEFDSSFLSKATWVEEYNFSFRTCIESDKIIWPFTKAYKGTATWKGPGTPVVEKKWMNGSTFTYMRLTDKV